MLLSEEVHERCADGGACLACRLMSGAALLLVSAMLAVALAGCSSAGGGAGTSEEGPCYVRASVTSESFQDSTSSWGGVATAYERDERGLVTADEAEPTWENTVSSGLRREYSYSEDGDALVATTATGGGTRLESRYEVRWEHDDEGRVVRQTSCTYDDASSDAPDYAQACEYVYDGQGRIRAVTTVVNGGEYSSVVLFDEDGCGVLHSTGSGSITAEEAEGYVACMTCEHDSSGRPTKTTIAMAGGDMSYVTTYEYDAQERVSAFTTVDSTGQEVVNCSVSYGADGQVSGVEDVVAYPGLTAGTRCEQTWLQVDDPTPFVRATSRLVTPESIGRLI